MTEASVFSLIKNKKNQTRPIYIILTKKVRLFVYNDDGYIVERVSRQRIPHNSLLLSEYANVDFDCLPTDLLNEISELMIGVKFDTKI